MEQMKLSKAAEKKYLDFCRIGPVKEDGEDYLRVQVDYNPIEEKVTIEEYRRIYRWQEYDDQGFVVEEDYDHYDNEYCFQRIDETTIEYTKATSQFRRQGSDDYGSYGPGDTSSYPTKGKESHLYQVPESFKLENGPDPSIMKEIEKKEATRRR